jgi:hypothetical protein
MPPSVGHNAPHLRPLMTTSVLRRLMPIKARLKSDLKSKAPMPVPMFNDDARRHSITNALPLRVHVCTLVRCSKLNAGTEARGDRVLTTK